MTFREAIEPESAKRTEAHKIRITYKKDPSIEFDYLWNMAEFMRLKMNGIEMFSVIEFSGGKYELWPSGVKVIKQGHDMPDGTPSAYIVHNSLVLVATFAQKYQLTPTRWPGRYTVAKFNGDISKLHPYGEGIGRCSICYCPY